MSEFSSDILDKKYDEEGNELDKHGFKVKKYPDGLGHVRASVENCEQLCGLDKNVMAELLKGEWSQYTTLDMTGRQSKKIVIEYEITQKKD
jgi:RNA 3'-terminal phosphate cyclase